MSHVMYHVSRHVSRHVSHVMCHVSHVTFFLLFFLDKVVKLIGGGSVINGAYPRLVFFLILAVDVGISDR